MKNSKKIAAAALVLVLLGGGGAVYADSIGSPLDALADATGSSVETIVESRQEGETLGSIAAEEGVLEQFQAAMTANREAVVQQRVEDGRLTQEEADQIKATIQEHVADCDGTGEGVNLNLGQEAGLGFGQQNQAKNGGQGESPYGNGNGSQGAGQYGMGSGNGLGTGTCLVE